MRQWAVLGVLAAGWCASGAAQDKTEKAEEPLSAKNFEHVVRIVRPSEAEAGWLQIPWFIDVDEARKKAAAEGKPLFVWGMAGEPLGTC
jgi:hypothetical protein